MLRQHHLLLWYMENISRSYPRCQDKFWCHVSTLSSKFSKSRVFPLGAATNSGATSASIAAPGKYLVVSLCRDKILCDVSIFYSKFRNLADSPLDAATHFGHLAISPLLLRQIMLSRRSWFSRGLTPWCCKK